MVVSARSLRWHNYLIIVIIYILLSIVKNQGIFLSPTSTPLLSSTPSPTLPAMPLRTQFTDALKDAMLKKDERTTGTVRLIMAKLKEADIAARPKGNTEGINDTEIASLLQGMIKQRRESIAVYEKANRLDMVKQESGEIAVIERFLPKQMSEDETAAAIATIIKATGASSIKDMGKVMGELKKNYAGQLDFAQAGAM